MKTAAQLLEMFTENRKPSFVENDKTPAFFLSDKQTAWFLGQAASEGSGLTKIISYTHNGKSFCFQSLSGKKTKKSAYVTVRNIN